MELIDYITIGYLVVLFLVTAYFRRDQENKLHVNLSYATLYSACLSTIGYFAFYYLVENHAYYMYIYLIIAVVILAIATVIAVLKYKHEK